MGNTQSLHARLFALMRQSLVVSATVRILALGAILVAFFGAITYGAIHAYEQGQSLNTIANLVSTVEKTASIAAHTEDAVLAGEVAKGLMTNPSLYEVRIESNDRVLVDLFKTMEGAVPSIGKVYSRVLFSPDVPEQAVGLIEISADNRYIDSQAADYALIVLLLLTATVLLVTFAVGVMTLFTIVQPIQLLSQVIQKIHPHEGRRIYPPKDHEENEIGELAHAFNELLDMTAALNQQQLEMRHKVERSELRFRTLVEQAATGLFSLDLQGHLLSWNPAFANMVEMPPAIDKPDQTVRLADVLPAHEIALQAILQQVLHTGAAQQHDFEYTSSQGARWLQLMLDLSEQGELQGILIDITERKAQEVAALDMAMRDQLTNILNRRGMETELAKRLEDGTGDLTLMLLDLDHFKRANDTYGHEAGDEVLVAITRRISRILRPQDAFCRIGGDEFVILLSGLTLAECEKLAMRIVHSISQKIKVQERHVVKIGVSIGIAVADTHEDSAEGAALSVESLIKRADAAMYQAKKAGRSRYALA